VKAGAVVYPLENSARSGRSASSRNPRIAETSPRTSLQSRRHQTKSGGLLQRWIPRKRAPAGIPEIWMATEPHHLFTCLSHARIRRSGTTVATPMSARRRRQRVQAVASGFDVSPGQFSRVGPAQESRSGPVANVGTSRRSSRNGAQPVGFAHYYLRTSSSPWREGLCAQTTLDDPPGCPPQPNPHVVVAKMDPLGEIERRGVA
jgi:hypothetical protein